MCPFNIQFRLMTICIYNAPIYVPINFLTNDSNFFIILFKNENNLFNKYIIYMNVLFETSNLDRFGILIFDILNILAGIQSPKKRIIRQNIFYWHFL